MPSISTLFWLSFPVILVALVYQIGLPAFVLKLTAEHLAFKVLRHLFTTKHCYASITTLVPGSSRVDCFSISNGKFSRVFLDDTAAGAVKQARSGHVIPGLWDGHGHLVQYGEFLSSVNIFGAESMSEVQRRLVQYKAGRPEVGTSKLWLRGVGWDQAHFGGHWPTSVSDISRFSDIFRSCKSNFDNAFTEN